MDKEDKPRPKSVRAFICHSSEKECIENYRLLSLYYEYRLKNKNITLDDYRKTYNPHYTVGDKIFNGEITTNDEEYKIDKERRINNFFLYNKFELE